MFCVTSFYHFVHFTPAQLDEFEQAIFDRANELNIKGLIILASEGLNATLTGTESSLIEMKSWCRQNLSENLFFKDSATDRWAFRRLIIKRREEIVTTTSPELTVENKINHHLSPEDWDEVLKTEKDIFLVDTRNWYETKIGRFKNAVDPEIDQFTEFGQFIDEQKLAKDKKILMYCTGGIRCEKGILELQKKGFTNVFQLEGGILNYMEKFPQGEFEGECFVFDGRVAVDHELKPSSKYQLCPYTGQPADIEISCVRCDTEVKISSEIFELGDLRSKTCSKNCAYHWALNPGRKGAKQKFEFARPPLIKNKTT